MRLVRTQDGVRLLTVKTARDLTATLDDYAERRVEELAAEELWIRAQEGLPELRPGAVKVYDAHSVPSISGRGRFAAALLERCPDLPVEEEGRLSDPRLRENFVERVFAYWRLRALWAEGGAWESWYGFTPRTS